MGSVSKMAAICVSAVGSAFIFGAPTSVSFFPHPVKIIPMVSALAVKV